MVLNKIGISKFCLIFLIIFISFSGLVSATEYEWSNHSSGYNSYWSDIAYGNGTFVAVAKNYQDWLFSDIMISSDGINWTKPLSENMSNFKDIFFILILLLGGVLPSFRLL